MLFLCVCRAAGINPGAVLLFRQTIKFINSSYNIYAFVWESERWRMLLAILADSDCTPMQTWIESHYRNFGALIYESSASQSSSRTLNFRWYRLHISFSSELSIAQLSSYEKLWKKRRTPSKSLSNNEKTFLLSRLFPLKSSTSAVPRINFATSMATCLFMSFDWQLFPSAPRTYIIDLDAGNIAQVNCVGLITVSLEQLIAPGSVGSIVALPCWRQIISVLNRSALSMKLTNKWRRHSMAEESTYLVHVWSKRSHQTRDNLKGSLEREVLEYAAVQLIQFALGSSL